MHLAPPTRSDSRCRFRTVPLLLRGLLCFALCVAAWSRAATAQAPAATATVDFAAPRAVRSASGVLYGAMPWTPAQFLAPLQPRLFRFSDSAPAGYGYLSWVAHAQAVHAVVPDVEDDLLLSNTWGYPVSNWNGLNQPPWQNWPAYENHLRGLVRMLANAGLHGTFEIWNEPDIPDFWNGTRDQFHETYRRAYQVVRSELGPAAAIGGPSFGSYDHQAMQAFLEFCLAQGCEVNTLIFHAADDTPAGMAAFPANVRRARTEFLDNPRYAPLRITRILVNEIGGPPYTHQPAGTLQRYAAFEEGGADAAARACWNGSGGVDECSNGGIDGLLTAGSLLPRSVWWAHTLYAAGVSGRVASTVSGANLAAIASRGAGSQLPQVLVGHVDFGRTINRQPATLSARLTLNNLRALDGFLRAGRVNVQVESIPDTGELALAAPVVLGSVPVDIVGGAASIDLPPMQVGQVLRLTMQPLEGGVPDPPAAFAASVVNGTISLGWGIPPTGPLPTGYLLEVGSRPDSADLLTLPLGNVTSFAAGAPRGSYFLRLRATNGSGRSLPTAAERIDVGCTAPPGPAAALQGSVAGSLVTIAWQRGGGLVDRHILEAGSGSGLSNLAVVTIAAGTTTFQAGAPPGTYFLRVREANECGASAPSPEIFLVVGASVALPEAPGTPIVAVNGSDVSLSWAPPASGGAPTAYRLEAGTAPGLANAAVITLGAAPAFSTGGVPPGTYSVRVRAINAAGVGPPSGDAAVVVP